MKLLVLILSFIFAFNGFSQTSVTADPDYAVKEFNKGVQAFSDKDFNQAILFFSNAIKSDPAHDKSYYNRGNAHLNLKNYAKAIEDYTMCTRIDPNNAKPYVYRAYCHEKLDHPIDAINDYSTALALEPTNSTALNNRALLLLDRKDYKNALKDLTKCTEVKNDAKVWFNKALCEYQLNTYDAALTSLTAAENADASYTKIYELRGKLYLKKEMYNEAISDLSKAIATNPTKDEFYYYRGYAKQLINNENGAVLDYTTSLELNPDNSAARKNRVYLLVALEQDEAALKDLDILLLASNKDEYLLVARGTIYVKMKNYQDAIIDLERAVSINDQLAEAYFNLATACYNTKKEEQSCKHVKRSYELGYTKAAEFIKICCQ